MDDQVLKVINHIKYVNKKKPSTLKIFSYLQNNRASNYIYELLENKIAELKNDGVIDETFEITNLIEEVLNFPEDDVDITSENSDISCLNTQSSQVDEENDATPSLNNNTLTPNPQAVFPSDFEILFQSLEDKLNGKISAIKSYLLDEVYDLKNELKVLQDNYLTENSESNEKEEICALKQKVKSLEVENKFLRNDVVCKQNLIDSLLEHNSNLLNHQCCRVIHDNIKIALSSIIHRSGHNFEDKINETNRKLENLCKGKGMIFINNSNIDSTCLNRSKLHLNKSGTSLLIKNFSKAVNSP